MDSLSSRAQSELKAEALIRAAGATSPSSADDLKDAVARFQEGAERLRQLDLSSWEPVLVYRPAEVVRDV